jgi:hypothetical protein
MTPCVLSGVSRTRTGRIRKCRIVDRQWKLYSLISLVVVYDARSRCSYCGEARFPPRIILERLRKRRTHLAPAEAAHLDASPESFRLKTSPTVADTSAAIRVAGTGSSKNPARTTGWRCGTTSGSAGGTTSGSTGGRTSRTGRRARCRRWRRGRGQTASSRNGNIGWGSTGTRYTAAHTALHVINVTAACILTVAVVVAPIRTARRYHGLIGREGGTVGSISLENALLGEHGRT